MAGTKKNAPELESEGAPMMIAAMTGREILPIGLIVDKTQIEGMQAVHRLIKESAFDPEAGVNEFPAVRTRTRIVTDLRIALRTSPLIIDSLVDAQEEKTLPKGVTIVVDGDEDEDEPSVMLDRCVIICKGAGHHVVSDDNTPVTLMPQFLEADHKREGELTEFVEKMTRILDKVNEDAPMVLADKSMAYDDMLSSPVGKAALVQAGSDEARRMTERRETQLATFRKGLSQLSTALKLETATSEVINFYSNPELGDGMNESYQVALNRVVMTTDI